MSDANPQNPPAIPLPSGVKVEGGQSSGVFKVSIPIPPNPSAPTKVDVDPGSHTHDIHVDTGENGHNPHVERRRNQVPTQVVVQQQQPNTGGLQGTWATIANMSAVGFVLVLSFIMYMDFRNSVKENNASIREEMQLQRTTDTTNLGNLTVAIAASTQASNALVAEVRANRVSQEAKLDKVIEYHAKFDKILEHSAKLEQAIDKLSAIIEKKM